MRTCPASADLVKVRTSELGQDLIADIEVKSVIWNRNKIALILYINYKNKKAKAVPMVLDKWT